MTAAKQDFKTPVGRLVRGSLYDANTTDAENKPLTVKSGPNQGKPRVDYFFALAIPKGGEQHWSQTPWGAQILAVAQQAFPRGQWQHPAFAWKVTDGDSAVPNKKNIAPNTREGYPGHWVLGLSSGFKPDIYQLDASLKPQLWMADKAINLGDYVEVAGTVDGNGSDNQPGVFLNHGMVCFRGYGQRIVVGPDASAVGFGAGSLPPGASATPLGAPNAFPAQGGPGAFPGQQQAPYPGAGVFPGPQGAPQGFAGAQAPGPIPGFAPAAGAMGAPGMGFAPPAGMPGSFPGQQPAPQQFPPAAMAPNAFPAQPGAPAQFPGMNGPASLGAPAQPGGFPMVQQAPGVAVAPQGFPGAAPNVGAHQVPTGFVPNATAFPSNVQPHTAFLNPGARQMTALAQGHSYESLIAQNWTDELLRSHGLML